MDVNQKKKNIFIYFWILKLIISACKTRNWPWTLWVNHLGLSLLKNERGNFFHFKNFQQFLALKNSLQIPEFIQRVEKPANRHDFSLKVNTYGIYLKTGELQLAPESFITFDCVFIKYLITTQIYNMFSPHPVKLRLLFHFYFPKLNHL